MKEYVVYILKSLSSDKHYVGYTQNLISRFRSHNELSTKGFTTRYRPWEVICVEFYDDKKTKSLKFLILIFFTLTFLQLELKKS